MEYAMKFDMMFEGVPRSGHWSAVAHAHLNKQPECLVCRKGRTKELNVHHKFPFHFVVDVGRPDLELDERNLYTMCVEHDEEHHLLIGHLGCFTSYNPWLENHMSMFRGLLASQIKSTHEWNRAVRNRPKPLGQMTPTEKVKLKGMLDDLFPLTPQSSQLATMGRELQL